MTASLPGVQFRRGAWGLVSAKIVAPISEENIGSLDGEVDLEVQRLPTLTREKKFGWREKKKQNGVGQGTASIL